MSREFTYADRQRYLADCELLTLTALRHHVQDLEELQVKTKRERAKLRIATAVLTRRVQEVAPYKPPEKFVAPPPLPPELARYIRGCRSWGTRKLRREAEKLSNAKGVDALRFQAYNFVLALKCGPWPAAA